MFTKTILIIALAIALTSCGSIEFNLPKKNDTPVATKNTSAPLNACPNIETVDIVFPPYNGFISGLVMETDLTRSLEMRVPEISYINSAVLQKKILARNWNTVIVLWTSCGYQSELDITELNKLFSLAKYDVYVICTDIAGEKQIKLIKKYYETKNFFYKSYNYYYKLSNFLNVKKEIDNSTQLGQFLRDISPIAKGENLPYIILADKDQNILYSSYISKLQSDSIDHIFANIDKYKNDKKLFQNFTPSNEDLELLAGKYSVINNNNPKSEIASEGASPEEIDYGQSFAVLNLDEKDINQVKENKIFKLSLDSLKKLLSTDKKKKLIHFWGGWCPETSYEIDKFADMVPKNGEYSLYLISMDCDNLKQKNLLRAYYNKINIKCDAFIVENVVNAQDEWLEKMMKIEIDYLQIIDKNISGPILPYTAVLDENNNLLYWRGCELAKAEEDGSSDKEAFMEKYAKNDFEKIKELLGK